MQIGPDGVPPPFQLDLRKFNEGFDKARKQLFLFGNNYLIKPSKHSTDTTKVRVQVNGVPVVMPSWLAKTIKGNK